MHRDSPHEVSLSSTLRLITDRNPGALTVEGHSEACGCPFCTCLGNSHSPGNVKRPKTCAVPPRGIFPLFNYIDIQCFLLTNKSLIFEHVIYSLLCFQRLLRRFNWRLKFKRKLTGNLKVRGKILEINNRKGEKILENYKTTKRLLEVCKIIRWEPNVAT